MKAFKTTIFLLLFSFTLNTSVYSQTVDLVANVDQVPPFTNGQTFNYTLDAVAGTSEYLGVRVKLNYDPSIVQLNSLTPIYNFDFNPTNDTVTPGLIKYEGGDLATPISGTISIFSIEFQVLDNTQNITISHEYTAPTGDGTVVVAVVAGNPVDVLGTANDIVLETLSVDTFNASTDISIFPNPAQHMVSIKLDNKQVNIRSIEIQTLEGKTILSKQIEGESVHNNQIDLDITTLPNALYFLTINTENGNRIISKLLVSH